MTGSDGSLVNSKARLCAHVSLREFALETVIVNLETGAYYGLNPTAMRMLGALDRSPTVGEAIRRLAREYGIPDPQVERDVTELCGRLLQRNLIEVSDAGSN